MSLPAPTASCWKCHGPIERQCLIIVHGYGTRLVRETRPIRGADAICRRCFGPYIHNCIRCGADLPIDVFFTGAEVGGTCSHCLARAELDSWKWRRKWGNRESELSPLALKLWREEKASKR